MLSRNIRVAERSFSSGFPFGTVLAALFLLSCLESVPPRFAFSRGKTRTDFFSGSLVAKCKYKC